MSLPESRNTTYAPDSPVKATDLNDLQDCIVEGKHGLRTRIFNGATANVDGVWTVGNSKITSTGAAGAKLQLDGFCKGDTIRDIRVRAYGNGTVDGSCTMYPAIDGSAGASYSATLTNVPAVATVYTIAAIDETIDTGSSFYLDITAAAAGLQILEVEVDFDHL